MTVTLNAESIRDFKICSFYYEQKHLLNEKVNAYAREQLADKFEDTLKRVVAFFFYKRQGGVTPSYNALLNRWEKLWFPKDTTASDITSERHESAHHNLASYSVIASAALLQFHEDFSGNIGDPIMIDEKFLIPLGSEVRLEGSFDLVLFRKNVLHVIRWSAKTKRPALDSFVYDFVAQKLATDYRNEKKRAVAYTLYDLGSTKPGPIEMSPGQEEVNDFFYWANEATSTELHIPRRGFTILCRGCPFDAPCSRFEYPKADV